MRNLANSGRISARCGRLYSPQIGKKYRQAPGDTDRGGISETGVIINIHFDIKTK